MSGQALTPLAARAAVPAVRWLALLGLCAAYLQGGLAKALDFGSAVGEMQHFGLAPAALLAGLVIVLELGASALVLLGVYRWLAALALAAFTVAASVLANNFWAMEMPARFMAENAFFEHLGLAGGFLLVAWEDLRRQPTA